MTTLDTVTAKGTPVRLRYIGGYAQPVQVDIPSAKINSRASISMAGLVVAQSGLPGGATHILPTDAGAVVVAAAQAEEIAAWYQAAMDADPYVQRQRLLSERQSLADDIGHLYAGIERDRERAFSRDIGGIPSYDDARIDTARAALAAWDSAHPEVVAAITEESASAAERFFASN